MLHEQCFPNLKFGLWFQTTTYCSLSVLFKSLLLSTIILQSSSVNRLTVGVQGDWEANLNLASSRNLAQELVLNTTEVLYSSLEASADCLLVIHRFHGGSKLLQPRTACWRWCWSLTLGKRHARSSLHVNSATSYGCIAHVSNAKDEAEDEYRGELHFSAVFLLE